MTSVSWEELDWIRANIEEDEKREECARLIMEDNFDELKAKYPTFIEFYYRHQT